jgi:hypothetical protein
MHILKKCLLILAAGLVAVPLANAGNVESASSNQQANATGQLRSSNGGQEGVTMPGDNRIYKPLAPEEIEKLGRDEYKRKMKEQR